MEFLGKSVKHLLNEPSKNYHFSRKYFKIFSTKKDPDDIFPLLTKFFHFYQIINYLCKPLAKNIHWWRNPSTFSKFCEIYPLLSSSKNVSKLARKMKSDWIYACDVFPLWRSFSTYIWWNMSTFFLSKKVSISAQKRILIKFYCKFKEKWFITCNRLSNLAKSIHLVSTWLQNSLPKQNKKKHWITAKAMANE